MTDTKIETGIRYVGEALAAIVKLLLPGDRVRAEYGPDLIIEGLLREWPQRGDLLLGPSFLYWASGRVRDNLTALTVLSLAPRPDPEPWWAGAEAVVDRDGAVWVKTENGAWGIAGETDWSSGAADGIEADYGPCTPIRQGGRTILSKEEIEKVIKVGRGRLVGIHEALTTLHGWREGEDR